MVETRTGLSFETERLILRDWREADRAPFAAMNADPEVMRYFAATLSHDESDAMIDRMTAHFEKHGFGLFALELKGSGAFIGFTGLNICGSNLPLAGEVEIGWRLAPAYWRRGLAFEAASFCLDWFWRNTRCERLVSFTSDHNHPSQALMRKLGFSHRPDLDFDHPAIPEGHHQRHQTVFVRDRSEKRNG